MVEYFTETGSWFTEQQLRERNITGIVTNAMLAGRDEDGTWSLVAEGSGKTKRVAGEDLTSSAFAYVGDSQDPSTWKLPIHFSAAAKSASHASNALARFNQTQGIPSGEKASVLAKIKAAAKKHGVDVSEGSKDDPEFPLTSLEEMIAELETLIAGDGFSEQQLHEREIAEFIDEILVEAGGGSWITTKDGRRINIGAGSQGKAAVKAGTKPATKATVAKVAKAADSVYKSLKNDEAMIGKIGNANAGKAALKKSGSILTRLGDLFQSVAGLGGFAQATWKIAQKLFVAAGGEFIAHNAVHVLHAAATSLHPIVTHILTHAATLSAAASSGT